jgi:hypothetical protein
MVIEIDTGQQPELGNFPLAEVIEVNDFDLGVFIGLEFQSGEDKADREAIGLRNDILDVISLPGAIFAIPSKAVFDIGKSNNLRAVVTHDIAVVKVIEPGSIEGLPDIVHEAAGEKVNFLGGHGFAEERRPDRG